MTAAALNQETPAVPYQAFTCAQLTAKVQAVEARLAELERVLSYELASQGEEESDFSDEEEESEEESESELPPAKRVRLQAR